MTKGNCPSCGGPVEFHIGSSAVVVCGYCRSVVARGDRAVEDLGKVAALIDTGSALRIGLTGKYRGKGFRLTGRTQLKHQAGGYWDEWYAAFDDGRWGWLAEAQGNLYLTFQTADDAPPASSLELGERVGDLTVMEIGTATLAAAEGEIPWRVVPGSRYQYADLAGEGNRFATIDYSEEKPLVFKGWQTSSKELGIEGATPVARDLAKLSALSCSQCGGALALRAPDQAERVICPNCGAVHNVEGSGLKYLKMLKAGKVQPVIPLGTTGKIDGVEYVVAGFMQRAVRFDKLYYWTEYLLFARNVGFRWLVHSDDHWSFVEPAAPGEVRGTQGSNTVHYQGRDYRIFQRAEAKVTYVVGEFYWRVEVGERVQADDYVAAPYGLSRERTLDGAKEMTWSHARYMHWGEVEDAFGVSLHRPPLPGPIQPFPGPNVAGAWGALIGLLLIMAIVIGVSRPRRVVYTEALELTEEPPTLATEKSRVYFSKPFDLTGRHNVAIEAAMRGENTWVYVVGDLVHEATGQLESFELPVEYYAGRDSDGAWSEGSRERKAYLKPPAGGRYLVRFEPHWPSSGAPPFVHVRVTEGVMRLTHLILAFFAITIPALLVAFWKWSFEVKRWKDSAFNPYASASDSEDDE